MATAASARVPCSALRPHLWLCVVCGPGAGGTFSGRRPRESRPTHTHTTRTKARRPPVSMLMGHCYVYSHRVRGVAAVFAPTARTNTDLRPPSHLSTCHADVCTAQLVSALVWVADWLTAANIRDTATKSQSPKSQCLLAWASKCSMRTEPCLHFAAPPFTSLPPPPLHTCAHDPSHAYALESIRVGAHRVEAFISGGRSTPVAPCHAMMDRSQAGNVMLGLP